MTQKLSLLDQLNLPSKQKTVLSKILQAKGQDLSDFLPEAVVYYVNTMLTNPEMLTEGIVARFKEAWFDGQDDDSSKALFDKLGFSDAELTVLSKMAHVYDDNVLDFAKGLLEEAVPSLLDADPFHGDGRAEKLKDLWKSDTESQEPTGTILDELGYTGDSGKVIIELAKNFEQTVEEFCRAEVISVAEGMLENPDVVGGQISRNLLNLLKKGQEKED